MYTALLVMSEITACVTGNNNVYIGFVYMRAVSCEQRLTMMLFDVTNKINGNQTRVITIYVYVCSSL